jgi:hypothetical protein
VLEPAYLGEELVTQDRNVRLGQPGRGEDVDDLALILGVGRERLLELIGKTGMMGNTNREARELVRPA